MERLCAICNTIFETNSWKSKYCSAVCKNKAKLLREKRYNSLFDFKYNSEGTKKRENHIIELNEKAKSLGLTYGQYMGIEYAKKNPILRRW